MKLNRLKRLCSIWKREINTCSRCN